MDGLNILKLLVLFIIFGTGCAIPVSIAWFEHRTRTKGLDTLRIYADREKSLPRRCSRRSQM